ncbi:MAG: ketohydroxyglutarate aldolase [Nitrospirales bacterium]|nr:ketohydroxyglutarate aldolase [Nitrospirales bacterium]
MAKKSVIVTLDDEHANSIEKVTDECRAAGLVVYESLDMLGQVMGEIDPDKESELRKISGVLSVEESQEYQLPPPNLEIQ